MPAFYVSPTELRCVAPARAVGGSALALSLNGVDFDAYGDTALEAPFEYVPDPSVRARARVRARRRRPSSSARSARSRSSSAARPRRTASTAAAAAAARPSSAAGTAAADDDHARAAVTDGRAFVGADGGVYGECAPPGDALFRGAANVEVSATAAAAAAAPPPRPRGHDVAGAAQFATTLGQRHWSAIFAHVGDVGAMRASFVPPPRVWRDLARQGARERRARRHAHGRGLRRDARAARRFGDADDEAFDADFADAAAADGARRCATAATRARAGGGAPAHARPRRRRGARARRAGDAPQRVGDRVRAAAARARAAARRRDARRRRLEPRAGRERTCSRSRPTRR